MFLNNTLFVLGAGASWHYGYPTGEGLIEHVISMADRISIWCNNRIGFNSSHLLPPKCVEQRMNKGNSINSILAGWEKLRRECDSLASALRTVRPLVIDYFLEWNVSLQPIGKLVIAAVILECEARLIRYQANRNRYRGEGKDERRFNLDKSTLLSSDRDDWYRFIVHKITYGCNRSEDIFKNNVNFVKFNYDASLEDCLYDALISIDMFKKQDVVSFLSDGRISHIYGSIRKTIPRGNNIIDLSTAMAIGPEKTTAYLPIEHEKQKILFDKCLDASNNIKIINPHEKESFIDELINARCFVEKSSVLYILGYGFDENNNKRIGLDKIAFEQHNIRSIMFTNFGDKNSINKKASNLLTGNFNTFLNGQTMHGHPKHGYVEKSVCNVYDALENDFDALESQLIGGSKI
jgi:hypothetical protein